MQKCQRPYGHGGDVGAVQHPGVRVQPVGRRGAARARLHPQRGLPYGEHPQEHRHQQVRFQHAAVDHVPEAVPAARRHLRLQRNLKKSFLLIENFLPFTTPVTTLPFRCRNNPKSSDSRKAAFLCICMPRLISPGLYFR